MEARYADTGRPMLTALIARRAVRYHAFETNTRQVMIRNTGTNTLWISFDNTTWFDVAVGAAWDDRLMATGFWFCTQLGMTTFVVNGLSLLLLENKVPTPSDDELVTSTMAAATAAAR